MLTFVNITITMENVDITKAPNALGVRLKKNNKSKRSFSSIYESDPLKPASRVTIRPALGNHALKQKTNIH